MSKVNRSTFQKVVEENKKLKADIKILVADRFKPLTKEQISVISKWRMHFKKEQDFSNLMYEAAKEYRRQNPFEFDFLKL